ncbi:hypothetical protein WHR41_04068 [Cladosporium halotolerans]|uniref:Pectinesterase n=1 Tax=Cladosporium halotolerans TaxID=1052096 RepID=A0AB34KP61_9PEZI
MKLITLFLSLVSLTLAARRLKPPTGALVVGSGKQFATISSAVAALSNTTTAEQTIFIHPGTYAEQVFIPKLAGPLTVYGSTKDDKNHAANTVTIVAAESQKTQPNNDLTATLRVWTTDFKLYNVNVKNAFGVGSQAVAVSANAGQQGYYSCALTGYQDTLLAQQGTQLYARSYIEGATDFIFGQRARAWFESCDIGVVANNQSGWVTASGRSSDDAGWYVINESRVEAAPGNVVEDGRYYLGRPWRSFARVVVQNTRLSKVISPAGWSVWNVGDERLENITFAEYGNKGPGAKGERASFAEELEAPVAIETVLGEGWKGEKYVDLKFL